MGEIRDNLLRVREAIGRACERAGRRADEVRLIAVSKTVPAERILEAVEAGCEDFGENYVQEAEAKIAHIGQRGRWHLIGHLQRNKAARAAALFDMVQSVDSDRLAERLNGAAGEAGLRLPVLIEVNAFGEESKTGVPEPQLRALVERVRSLEHLKLEGLMGIPPPADNEADQRRRFRDLYTLWQSLPAESRQELSMGMSADYPAAIAEGATMIRIGTAIFGARQR